MTTATRMKTMNAPIQDGCADAEVTPALPHRVPGYSTMPRLGGAHRRHAARFGHTPPQVREARRWARTVTGLSQEEADVIELVLSELVTNALRHTASGQNGHFTVTIAYLDTDVIRLAVEDAGPRHGAVPSIPRVRPMDPGLENGRGLALVERLSRRWGFLGVQGTPLTVWAAISRSALR